MFIYVLKLELDLDMHSLGHIFMKKMNMKSKHRIHKSSFVFLQFQRIDFWRNFNNGSISRNFRKSQCRGSRESREFLHVPRFLANAVNYREFYQCMTLLRMFHLIHLQTSIKIRYCESWTVILISLMKCYNKLKSFKILLVVVCLVFLNRL